MRTVPFLFLLAACRDAVPDIGDLPSLSRGRLEPTSSFPMPFDGIFVAPGRTSGLAGVGTMLCEYGLDDAEMSVDTDPSGGDESVQDGVVLGDGTLTLGLSSQDVLYEMALPEAEVTQSWHIPGAIAARYVSEGIVVLRQSADACRLDVLSGRKTVVPSHFCGGASLASTGTGVVLVDRDGAVRVEAGVVTELPFSGTSVVWRDGALVASGDTISADGWMVDLGGPVSSIAPLGDGVVASVGGETTHLVVLGADGSVTSDQEIDREAGRLWGSDDRVLMSTPHGADAFVLR
jgi:hypothetical protein